MNGEQNELTKLVSVVSVYSGHNGQQWRWPCIKSGLSTDS